MAWAQHELELAPRARGFHLVTDEITGCLSQLQEFKIGLLHLFIRHTSASLTINENADRSVRYDMEMAINQIVPEQLPYTHTIEGPDDMPAHVKASLLGAGLLIPIRQGRLVLGTWQGIYLCEHRDHAVGRRIIATLQGE